MLALVHLTRIVGGDSGVHYGGQGKSSIILIENALADRLDIAQTIWVYSFHQQHQHNTNPSDKSPHQINNKT